MFLPLNYPSAYGSGYVAAADQIALDWPDHPPILLVDISYQGEPLPSWINDDIAIAGSWPLRTGYAATMFNWLGGRITAIFRPFVVNFTQLADGTPITTRQGYDMLIGMYEQMLTNQPSGTQFPVWVAHIERTGRTFPLGNKLIRENTVTLLAGGGRYKLLHGPALGARVRGDGDGHQADGTSDTGFDPVAHKQGNILLGRYMGRGMVAQLKTMMGISGPPDVLGPRILKVDFTDASMSAIAITFDRPVRTTAGATVDLPQHWVAMDNWANVDAKVELLGVLQNDLVTVICPKPQGATWTLALRYDYSRDTPWATEGGLNGGEINIQSKLDLLLRDSSSFDEGRGMTVYPEMKVGYPVALPFSVGASNATGSVVMRLRRA